MAGIVVQDPLQDLGVHQGPIKERRGHGVSEKGKACETSTTPCSLANLLIR